MNDILLLYEDVMSTKLATILSADLGIKFDAIEFFGEQRLSFTFRGYSKGTQFFIKIFRLPPSRVNIVQIEQLLNQSHISHAKTLLHQTSDSPFSYGYLVQEWVPGIPIPRAIEQRLVHRPEVFSAIGQILNKVHQIKLKNYAILWDDPQKTYTTYSAFSFALAELTGIRRLEADGLIPLSLSERIYTAIEKYSAEAEPYLVPVLSHGDPSLANILWDSDSYTLLDWENACSASPALDLGWFRFYHEDMYSYVLEGYGTMLPNVNWEALALLSMTMFCLRTIARFTYEQPIDTRREQAMRRLQETLVLLEG